MGFDSIARRLLGKIFPTEDIHLLNVELVNVGPSPIYLTTPIAGLYFEEPDDKQDSWFEAREMLFPSRRNAKWETPQTNHLVPGQSSRLTLVLDGLIAAIPHYKSVIPWDISEETQLPIWISVRWDSATGERWSEVVTLMVTEADIAIAKKRQSMKVALLPV